MNKKMKVKIYKTKLTVLLALLMVGTSVFAQDISVSVNTDHQDVVSVKAKVKTKELKRKLDAFSKNLEASLNNMSASLSNEVENIAPRIVSGVTNMVSNINVEVNTDGGNYDYSLSDENGNKSEKFKTYSKSYPIDGNDRIKLSNEYGKIAVNTWDRPEVKVDVQIKAEAGNDEDAQKILDGVHITDSKEGNQVSFRTQIERNSSSWKLWNFGNGKKHKVEINYTVYMPARTDLTVEDSYGSIQLPDLAGKIKISSSYGSVAVQNLSNPSNTIEGSYGSLKMGSMNGGHLDFSYGSVDIDECSNIVANLSYGSFKLGRLKGAGDLDLSYVGGFKIDELANSFKKLKIDASYSGVTLGVPDGNNFDFDITTSYGGFNYNDNKVIVTSKTPADGSRHIGPTRNYKGHFGKEGADAAITIHTSYGGVNFE
jgi:hypothetical protein